METKQTTDEVVFIAYGLLQLPLGVHTRIIRLTAKIREVPVITTV